MKPNDETVMIADLIRKKFEQLKKKLEEFSDVRVAEKATGKITREEHYSLQSATARRTRDKILEGKIAVDLIATMLEKERGLVVKNKQYIPRGGVILGTMQTDKTAISVVSVTKMKHVPAAVNRLAKQTRSSLVQWIIEEYEKIYAALVYFDVESPIFDILLYELVFDR